MPHQSNSNWVWINETKSNHMWNAKCAQQQWVQWVRMNVQRSDALIVAVEFNGKSVEYFIIYRELIHLKNYSTSEWMFVWINCSLIEIWIILWMNYWTSNANDVAVEFNKLSGELYVLLIIESSDKLFSILVNVCLNELTFCCIINHILNEWIVIELIFSMEYNVSLRDQYRY